jgi:hypothetical protein
MPQYSVIFWKLVTNLYELLGPHSIYRKNVNITNLWYGFTSRYLQMIMYLFGSYGSQNRQIYELIFNFMKSTYVYVAKG